MAMEDNKSAVTMGVRYEYDDLVKMPTMNVLEILKRLDIEDNGFAGRDDMATRIMLTQRKADEISHTPYEKFEEVKTDTAEKCDSLTNILTRIYRTFGIISTKPLSDVLLNERLLKHDDLLDEILARNRVLKLREFLVPILGETNGGKSTFINLILGGEEILPTDVIHCTFAITKIKYSDTYSIETLDNDGVKNTYPCEGCKDANAYLKKFVAEEDQNSRLQGSKYTEITLKMPAKILKSGMTLVDTPGIGEMDQMDDVTMNYVKSTRAAAFIYIIKSDTAGGVQEDRLVSFLRAIQEDFKKDNVDSAIDPRAALFVCNRWDAINKDEEDIVKMNALTKLDIVWPGFKPEQLHFFSSKKAQLHIEADPEFVTDQLNSLLISLTKLFHRAVQNSIQHQYKWAKFFLQRSSRHLSSMINHCIRNNEELEDFFRTVAAKQEILMKQSNESSPDFQEALATYKEQLKFAVLDILSKVQPETMEDFEQLTTIITPEFIDNSQNKQWMDQWMVNALIYYCDKKIQECGLVQQMENEAKSLIEKHVGLHKEQIQEIIDLVRGQAEPSGPRENSRRRSSALIFSGFGSSVESSDSSSSASGRSSLYDMFENTTMNTVKLESAVETFFDKRKKKRGPLKMRPSHVKTKLFSAFQTANKKMGGSGGKGRNDIPAYVQRRIHKNAFAMSGSDEIIEGLAAGYLHVIKEYMESALENIPHFISVNNKLMDNIRDHRKLLKDDKTGMMNVMTYLESHREHVRGYGLLYVEDTVNADSVHFDTDKCVTINDQSLDISVRLHDSGFIEYGSTRNKGRGFWTHTRSAVIKVDTTPTDVTLKTYTSSFDKNLQFSEIAALRYLENSSLAPFFGMTRVTCNSDGTNSPEKMTTFIFKGSLVSARVFRRNSLINQQEFVQNFIQELVSGLEYLHRENMVHLELNLDTVMVNYQSGTVQLCQQCKPRAIQLPKDLSIMTNSSICLSPSVLGGEYEYCSSDDIYAFVILLWELLFPGNLPYEEERKWPLKEFIEKVCPSKMLGPLIDKLDASDAVVRVFKNALLTGRKSHCLTARDIRSLLKDLSFDHTVQKIINKRRQVIKRGSRTSLVEQEPVEKIQPEQQQSTPSTAASDKPGPPPTRPPRQADARRRRTSLPNIMSPPNQAQSLSELRKHTLENAGEETARSQSSDSDDTMPNPSGIGADRMAYKKYSGPCIKLNEQNTLQDMYKQSLNSSRVKESGTDQSMPRGRRERKVSAPTIKLSDQRILQEMHAQIQRNKLSEEPNLNASMKKLGDEISLSMSVRGKRERKRSAPTIKLSDQRILQEMHAEIQRNNLPEEPNLNTSIVEREDDTSPPMRSRNRGRKCSVPNIDLNEQNKLQELDNVEKTKKKWLTWRTGGKPRIKKQQHVRETDGDLNIGNRRTMYASMPGQLNTLPTTQSEKKNKSIFNKIVGKLNTQKGSRNSSPCKIGNDEGENVPNLHRLAGEHREKLSQSRKSASEDDPPTTSSRLLDHTNAPKSPRTLHIQRRSLTSSPKFEHRWTRSSIRSNSSAEVDSEGECNVDNRRIARHRSSNNNSLYSTYVTSVLLDRPVSIASDDEIDSQMDLRERDESELDGMSTPTNALSNVNGIESNAVPWSGFDASFSISSSRRSEDDFGTSNALPSPSDVYGGSRLSHRDTGGGFATSLSSSFRKDVEDDLGASNALPLVSDTFGCSRRSQGDTGSVFATSFLSSSNKDFEDDFGTSSALPSMSGAYESSRSSKGGPGSAFATSCVPSTNSDSEDDFDTSNALPSNFDAFGDSGMPHAFANVDSVEDDWSPTDALPSIDKNENNNYSTTDRFPSNDSFRNDASVSNAFPSVLDNAGVSGYYSSSDFDNNNMRSTRVSSESPPKTLSDKLPPLSFGDMSFAD